MSHSKRWCDAWMFQVEWDTLELLVLYSSNNAGKPQRVCIGRQRNKNQTGLWVQKMKR